MRGSIIATCLLLVAGSAWAAPKKDKKSDKTAKDKDKDKDKDKGGPEIEMEGEATAPTPTTTTTTTATPDPATTSVTATPAPPPSGFPIQIDDRPLTLPKSKLDVHGGFPILVVTVPTGVGMANTTNTTEGFAVGAAYGVDDKLEIGADYAFLLNPGNIKGPLTFHAAYTAKHDAKLDFAIAGALALDFVDTTDSAMKTTTTTLFSVQLGAWLRYRLASKVSLFTGIPALPSSSLSLSKLAIALPPVPYQIEIGLAGSAAVAVELPVGIGFQATPNVYAFASMNLANIRISNTQNRFLFADFIPIALGGFYSMDKFDVGAVFADDLQQAADYLSFFVTARYFVK